MSDTGPEAKTERTGILFVDDEENVLRSLKRLFIDEEYEIHTALSGEAGLEILRDREIAVVVSDQRMPRMSGAEFLERSRLVSPESVRIVLTGHADIEAAIAAINKGGTYQYITKPWDNEEMKSSVFRAAERYRLGRENKRLAGIIQAQNEELKKWTSELEQDVQEQSIELTYKNAALRDLNEQLETGFRNFSITMSNLIELRDKTVGNHSGNVCVLARKMAARMDLNDTEVQTIAMAAQLHDIGKIGVPDAILSKDVDSMAPFELSEYQTHPVRGQAAMDSNAHLREAGKLVRHHHEAFGGGGFPDGLKGDMIPLGSRIIAVSDRYHRLLVTHSVKDTLERIVNLAGIEFDPHVARLLVEIVRENESSERRPDQAVESELHPEQLMAGMVLSREVRSGTGLLLLPQGSRLNPQKIESIRRYYTLDPPRAGVYVWTQGS